VKLKNSNKYMIYKNIKADFGYITWLKARMERLRFGIKYQTKTDNSTDFEMLANKLKAYEQEYTLLIDELYSLLKNYDLSRKTNNIRQSG
jgi:hypothetical protein